MRIEPFSEVHRDEVVALCACEGWLAWTPEKVERAFSAPGVIAVVAIKGSEVVGVAELLTDGEVMAYLALLIVSRDMRRQGVARALIQDLFVRSGLARIDLLSETSSMPFYEALPHKTKPGYRIYDGEPSPMTMQP